MVVTSPGQGHNLNDGLILLLGGGVYEHRHTNRPYNSCISKLATIQTGREALFRGLPE